MSKTHPSPIKKKTISSKKHTSKKHKREFLKVYWPYLPLFVLVFLGMTFGYNWQTTGAKIYSPKNGVLAYATEMSVSGLLSATNSQRAQNGNLPALVLNSKLSSAAQAKANDMVARNYWSHTTPDGQDPWVFIDATGYAYQKAGENLAYGFDTSSETVIGWMNSPGHRANILDTSYKEVGFGFANAASFVSTGEETVVVAMYANPTSSVAATQAPQQTAPTPPPKQQPAAPTPAAQPTQQDTIIPAKEESSTPTKVPDDRYNEAITSDNEVPAAQPATRITKIQTITSGYAPWSAAVMSGVLVLVVGLWVLKHAVVAKKVLIDGEQFVLHHPLIDVAVLIIVAAAIHLSQSSGIVK